MANKFLWIIWSPRLNRLINFSNWNDFIFDNNLRQTVTNWNINTFDKFHLFLWSYFCTYCILRKKKKNNICTEFISSFSALIPDHPISTLQIPNQIYKFVEIKSVWNQNRSLIQIEQLKFLFADVIRHIAITAFKRVHFNVAIQNHI